jgi:hypothetical protein
MAFAAGTKRGTRGPVATGKNLIGARPAGQSVALQQQLKIFPSIPASDRLQVIRHLA